MAARGSVGPGTAAATGTEAAEAAATTLGVAIAADGGDASGNAVEAAVAIGAEAAGADAAIGSNGAGDVTGGISARDALVAGVVVAGAISRLANRSANPPDRLTGAPATAATDNAAGKAGSEWNMEGWLAGMVGSIWRCRRHNACRMPGGIGAEFRHFPVVPPPECGEICRPPGRFCRANSAASP